MADATRILVPLLNPNETDARLVALHVKTGQQVEAGDPLATLETTKSTFELEADAAGYVAGLQASEGELLHAGDIFCYLAPDVAWQAPEQTKSPASPSGVPKGLRITQPALLLAQKEGLDLGELPVGPIITEDAVRAALKKSKPSEIQIPKDAAKKNAIVVYGGGGHGKAVIELIQATGEHTVIGLIDDALAPGDQVLDVPVIGGGEALAALKEAGCGLAANAVGGIGAISTRIAVFERIQAAGFQMPALVHPSAVVEPSAQLADGVQVFPQAYVGSDARVGLGCIVNTGAIVSHDCVLDEYANLAPGGILAGGVRVGDGALIGMGVTINLNVNIGRRARIGNSAVIKEDLPPEGIVRAGAVWPER
jgi:sugar O-acyltransferase (sialic acid O-acetyltransferase NeuD family)